MNNGFVVVAMLLFAALLFGGAITLVLVFGAPALGRGVVAYTNTADVQLADPLPPPVVHMEPPEAVKAIYISQCAAASRDFRTRLYRLVDETEINSVIIDIKDFTGTVSLPHRSGDYLEGDGCVVSDMESYVRELHERGVYVIGRITVFQDPLYASVFPDRAVQSKTHDRPWQDYKGLEFVDVGARPFWDYIVSISHEAHRIGFDELNYDYIRYPSDGPMRDAAYTHSDYTNRAEEIEKFFRYLASHVRRADPHGHVPMLSADLFGMVTTNRDDLTIGQVLERATPYFDIIAPMTYPSHYPPGFNGYANPNDNVYGVIKYSLDRAIERLESATTTVPSLAYERIGTTTPAVYRKPVRDRNILRPWLQDFDYGGNYGPDKVRAQIQATYDAGVRSWFLWDPANRYTREALNPAATSTTE